MAALLRALVVLLAVFAAAEAARRKNGFEADPPAAAPEAAVVADGPAAGDTNSSSDGNSIILITEGISAGLTKNKGQESDKLKKKQRPKDKDFPDGPAAQAGNGLSKTYYDDSCPELPSIIWKAINKKIKTSASIIPQVVRLHFHDCFIRGCDASVLLNENTTKNVLPEKLAEPNHSLEGFQAINWIKREVEEKCPGIVSCSDVLALSARDLVYAAGGPYVELRLGRKDGFISRAPEAVAGLPPTGSIDAVVDRFQRVGLDVTDVATLSGGHTVGDSFCQSTVGGDILEKPKDDKIAKLMNEEFKVALGSYCQTEGPLQQVNFDPISPIKFDNQYFINIRNGVGILDTDLMLAHDERTAGKVKEFAEDQDKFFEQWKESWFKMSEINVLTGHEGEIRKVCSFPNDELHEEFEEEGFVFEEDVHNFHIPAN